MPMYGTGSGNVLRGGRYRILRELGRGGFGHTYLAEDTHRFNELCVLKAFAPQVQGEAALEKAQQLFEREAGILYQLDHPQIPRFRELLREQGQIYLVQDYVEGPTYQELLDTRRNYDGHFTEGEVRLLLQQVLPVLQYLHSVGVVHRDLSPDNLIQRNADQLPVLIDFGGVKQLVVNVRYQMGVQQPYQTTSGQVTRLGKVGYAPPEQLQSGMATPSSDLYSLGVTVLVLLTGDDPEALFDPRTQTWRWRERATVHPTLERVLNQMVAPRPADRYTGAAAVLTDLNLAQPYQQAGDWQSPMPMRMQPMTPPPPDPPPTPPPARANTQAAGRRLPPPTMPVAPTPDPAPPERQRLPSLPPPQPIPQVRSSAGCLQALFGLLVVLVLGGTGWWWLQSTGVFSNLLPGDSEAVSEAGNDADNPAFSPEEQARKQAIQERTQALGVDRSYLVSLTDQLFYEQNPDRQGTQLTDNPEDAPLRAAWDAIAIQMLDLLEQSLSTEARERLGRYNPSDLDRWKSQVNELYVSTRALYDLTDARYDQLFPGLTSEGFVEKPIDQIWFALAQDQVNALQSGQRLSEIQFEQGTFSQQIQGSLNPGEGQVYILNLSAGQLMRLNLQANPPETLLSLYLPSPTQEQPFLLADSTETTWAGELPQTGYYEIVVVSKANQPLTYRLSVAVDNVINDAISKPEAPEKKN